MTEKWNEIPKYLVEKCETIGDSVVSQDLPGEQNHPTNKGSRKVKPITSHTIGAKTIFLGDGRIWHLRIHPSPPDPLPRFML